jgi:hypothetical protein
MKKERRDSSSSDGRGPVQGNKENELDATKLLQWQRNDELRKKIQSCCVRDKESS